LVVLPTPQLLSLSLSTSKAPSIIMSEDKEVPVYAVWHDTISGAGWDINKYVPSCSKAISDAGGEILSWDMAVDSIEGTTTKKAIAIVKFPSRAKFEQFYNDPVYQDALKLRLDNTDAGSWAAVARAGVHGESA
jgi:uncharacterized protein (DUF1330 family)